MSMHIAVCSEDSDNWVMGVKEWHAGYATCATNNTGTWR